ncbi:MAG: NUDIX domain-containing protein [Chloroflexi bacterium]|nr:NUDIX domain-containing protein [Chloroflexota bacterium]
MLEATLCFLIRAEAILLGLKKVGFGAGKYGGFGGKVEAGETPEMAAVREMAEETGIKLAAEELQRVGHLTFLFPYQPAWSQVVHVFLARSWDGQAVESAEARPVWCPTSEIPYARMWQDSAYWLPRILAGQQVRARFTFREDNESVAEVEMEAWPGAEL